MARITCDVIKDLLPLYVEECASDDTCVLIEEHLLYCMDCKEELEKLKEPIVIPADTEQILVYKLKKKQRRQKIIRFVGMAFIMFVFAIAVLVRGHLREENAKNVEIFAEILGEKVAEASIQMLSQGQQEYYTSNPKQMEEVIALLKSTSYKVVKRPIDFKMDYQLKLNYDDSTIEIGIDGAVISIDNEYYETSRLIGEKLFLTFKEQAADYMPDPSFKVKEISRKEYRDAFDLSKGYTVGDESAVVDESDYRFYEIVVRDDFFSDINPIEERFYHAVNVENHGMQIMESFRCYHQEAGYEIEPESYISEVRNGAIYSEWGYNRFIMVGQHGASNEKENFRGSSFGYHIAFVWNPDTLIVSETQIKNE